MGLPIWRDPEEKKSSKSTIYVDPTAAARTSIRRRPSVHGRRGARTRLNRDPSLLPPRFERSPLPSTGFFNGIRQRGGEHNLSSPLRPDGPPPPAPETQPLIDSSLEQEEGIGATRSHISALTRVTRPQDVTLSRRQPTAPGEEGARTTRHVGHSNATRPTDSVDDLRAAGQQPRRSITPHRSNEDSSNSTHTILLNPGEPLRIIRSPEPMLDTNGHGSGSGSSARRAALPTPPLDTSGPEERSHSRDPNNSELHLPSYTQPLHHVSNALRATSPVNGLGDRVRSPTPEDGWEIMRATITPDETLPSADSSFASAAASQSFNASGSNSTHATEPDTSSLSSSRRDAEDYGSESSADLEDQVCIDDDLYSTVTFAEEVYIWENSRRDGRERIAAHERERERNGNRFALAGEPVHVDLGFRLVEEALETEEGRRRILEIQNATPETERFLEIPRTALSERQAREDSRERARILERERRRRERRREISNRRGTREGRPYRRPHPYLEAYSYVAEPRDARPYLDQTRGVVEQTRPEVNNYFRRFEADALEPRAASPPPRYEAVQLSEVLTLISRDTPEPQPVSPPGIHLEREASDALLSGDVQELDSMRRIVERLAARDDVPEDWWASMGLNFSRSRPRARSAGRLQMTRSGTAPNMSPPEVMDRIRSGRIERGNSRL